MLGGHGAVPDDGSARSAKRTFAISSNVGSRGGGVSGGAFVPASAADALGFASVVDVGAAADVEADGGVVTVVDDEPGRWDEHARKTRTLIIPPLRIDHSITIVLRERRKFPTQHALS
jgi:hypothetical protein